MKDNKNFLSFCFVLIIIIIIISEFIFQSYQDSE